MNQDYREPVYTIGITAGMLKVCPETLRIWERKKLIKPSRIGKNRFYSQCDMERLRYIKELLREKRINIEGVKGLLDTSRCWEVKNASPKRRGPALSL